MFGLALVQGEWKVYVSGLLDREQQDWYLLNITASDGLYVAHTAVEVTVMDANDNRPICNQVRDKDKWKVCKMKICKVNKPRGACGMYRALQSKWLYLLFVSMFQLIFCL